jgi:PKD repeat protein
MTKTLALVGLPLLCVLLSSCGGTYRAIVRDYASDAPTVDSITPLHGVSGEDVQFEALLCLPAGAAITIDEATGGRGYAGKYIWNFGGGAEPNISHDASPRVTLRDGLRSPYDCTLTLIGSCNGEDENKTATYHFSLAVAPITVLGVAPTTGVAGASATFTAIIGSGSVNRYSWDFGGACNPNGSNSTSPTVNFVNSASGLYNCRLIVSNEFELFEFPFVLQVTPAPTQT